MDESLLLKLNNPTHGPLTSTVCFSPSSLNLYEYRPIGRKTRVFEQIFREQSIVVCSIKASPTNLSWLWLRNQRPVISSNVKKISRFLLRVLDHHWHEACLRCSICDKILSHQDTCFMRNGSIYCKDDYAQWVLRFFSTKNANF